MRTFLTITISLFVLFFSTTFLLAESGPGNGTDYVKVLFADAQYELSRQLSPLDESSLSSLGLSAEIEGWLRGRSEGESRFLRVKHFLRRIDLRFQQQPCSDGSGKPASICFFAAPEPYVLVSLQENKMTTKDQAMAMLVHEAGHLAGEVDHRLLDRVGVALVQAIKVPLALFADATSLEIVANPFQGKADCESGSSPQAIALREEARIALLRQCSERGLRCEDSRISYSFQGEANFRDGVGFDMRVSCRVRAVLRLR